MKFRAILAAVAGLVLFAFSSCLFQNDPVGPTRAPSIDFVSPSSDTLFYETPAYVDLRVEATDPDRDELHYHYKLGDSILANSNRMMFKSMRGDTFDVKVEVSDGGGLSVIHHWIIVVIDTHNQPPVIKHWHPYQDSVTCLIGNLVHFEIDDVIDESPGSLSYKFLLEGPANRVSTDSTSSIFTHWFGSNGIYNLTATVWDGMYGDTISWGIKVEGEPDTIPPAAINDLEAWRGENPGEIILEWTAPGDDGMDGHASGYKIRTAEYWIRTENDWEDAASKTIHITPASAGTLERVVISGLSPGTDLYVTVRAYDDYYSEYDENAILSPVGKCERVLARGYDASGTAFDIISGRVMEGCYLSAYVKDTTDASGTYSLIDIPYYVKFLRGMDEQISGEVGDYYDFRASIPNRHFNMDVYLIRKVGLFSLDVPERYNHSDFLTFLRGGDGFSSMLIGVNQSNTIFKRWDHLPITVYNPEVEYEGHPEVNLQLIARESFNLWDQSIPGVNLFEEVDDEEEADVKIIYENNGTGDKHNVDVTNHEDGTPAHIDVRINLDYTMIPMFRPYYARMVFSHEFGHVLRLAHSRDPGHLMFGYGTPYSNTPTVDELNLIRVIYRVPNRYDVSRFEWE